MNVVQMTDEALANAEARKKRRAQQPATRGDVDATRDGMLAALVDQFKTERRLMRGFVEALTEKRLCELDGAHLLLGSARKVAAANLAAITTAIAPTTQRKSIVVEGAAPQWAAGVFK